jgi:hypothetical protein
VPLVLAALLLPVVAYCSVRALAPRWGGPSLEHRRALDLWHVLMGTAMTAMLLGLLIRPLALTALAVCAAGLAWGVLGVRRRIGSAAHVRLIVGAGAMAVMTLPLAAPATASSGHGSDAAMAGMGPATLAPFPVTYVLLIGLLVVAAVRSPDVVRRSQGSVARLDAGCDVLMAVGMTAMLIALE